MPSITDKVRQLLDLELASDSPRLEKILKQQIVPALKELEVSLCE
jgi:hypothetical protein